MATCAVRPPATLSVCVLTSFVEAVLVDNEEILAITRDLFISLQLMAWRMIGDEQVRVSEPSLSIQSLRWEMRSLRVNCSQKEPPHLLRALGLGSHICWSSAPERLVTCGWGHAHQGHCDPWDASGKPQPVWRAFSYYGLEHVLCIAEQNKI